jgi:hypothetical protein
MSSIYATDYTATTAAVAAAIQQSVQSDEAAHLFPGARIGYASVEALAHELLTECEDSVDAEYVTEYTGVNLDGQTWRVHLHRPQP